MNCHAGKCTGAEKCKKKVKCYCICKNKKTEISCDKIKTEGISVVACDESCFTKKNLKILDDQRKIEDLEEIEAEKDRKELKEYELKFGRKKPKERKQRLVEAQEKNYNRIIGLASFSIVLIAFLIYSFFL